MMRRSCAVCAVVFFLTVHCFDLVLNKAAVRTHISSVFKVVWWSSWDIEYLVCFCSLKFILKKQRRDTIKKEEKKRAKKWHLETSSRFIFGTENRSRNFPTIFNGALISYDQTEKLQCFEIICPLRKHQIFLLWCNLDIYLIRWRKKKPCDIFFVYKNDFSSKNEVICNMRNETIQPKC